MKVGVFLLDFVKGRIDLIYLMKKYLFYLVLFHIGKMRNSSFRTVIKAYGIQIVVSVSFILSISRNTNDIYTHFLYFIFLL